MFCTPATGRFVEKVLCLSLLPTPSLERKTSRLFKFSKMLPYCSVAMASLREHVKCGTHADVFQLCPSGWVFTVFFSRACPPDMSSKCFCMASYSFNQSEKTMATAVASRLDHQFGALFD